MTGQRKIAEVVELLIEWGCKHKNCPKDPL